MKPYPSRISRLAPVVLGGLGGLWAVAAARAAPTDDAVVSGFNADVVSDADPGRRRVTTAFDVASGTWVESGLFDGKSGRSDGLPSGATFTSATGSGARYTLRPAAGPNVLRLGLPNGVVGSTSTDPAGTLELKPAQYSAIAILAASGNASPTAKASGTIHYSQGPPTPFTYLAADWRHGPAARLPNLALGNLTRNSECGADGTHVDVDPRSQFGLWETVITPKEGLDPNRIVTSITFQRANEASGGTPPTTSIFAVSGETVPEATSMAVVFSATLCLALGARPGRDRGSRRAMLGSPDNAGAS